MKKNNDWVVIKINPTVLFTTLLILIVGGLFYGAGHIIYQEGYYQGNGDGYLEGYQDGYNDGGRDRTSEYVEVILDTMRDGKILKVCRWTNDCEELQLRVAEVKRNG